MRSCRSQSAEDRVDALADRLDAGHAVDAADDALRLVMRQDRRGLGAIFGHAGAHRLLIVVGTALEFVAAAHVAGAGADGLLGARGRGLDHVIELEVDEDALVDRIAGRFSCTRCNTPYHDRYKLPQARGICDVCGSTEFKRRADDNEAAVRTRMAEYRAKTAPILPFYEAQGLVRRVDGMADIDEVSAQIAAILDGNA